MTEIISYSTLSFDHFDRTSSDIVCVTPVRTIVRREEEIVLVRKVRKVEEIDASPACPVNSVPAGMLKVNAIDEEPTFGFTNIWGKTVTVKIQSEGTWAYGNKDGFALQVTGDGNLDMTEKEQHESDMRFPTRPAALVTLKNGQFAASGKEQTITVEPDETVSFINNDEIGFYHDNSDFLTVKWSVLGI